MREPIENHGVIGDLRTVALVAGDGTIDFMCAPTFDSPTVFADLVHPGKGGSFRIAPQQSAGRHLQMYLPETNVLLTRFLSAHGVGELIDLMPIAEIRKPQRVIRQVRAIRGALGFTLRCAPRFDYARAEHTVRVEGTVARFLVDGRTRMQLVSPFPLRADGLDVTVDFTVPEGEVVGFVLEFDPDESAPTDPSTFCEGAVRATTAYWQTWIRGCTYNGRWTHVVHRSALALRLLFDDRHGSMVAAPTFGLPELPGGIRNWDYRYTWIRDTAFTVYTFTRLGFFTEAERFMGWIDSRTPRHGPPLQPMYRLDGSLEVPEVELPHFDGYANSRPVRIGNAAVEQLQLDVYGELLDALYLVDRHHRPLSIDRWDEVLRVTDWVCENWRRPDSGIWEVRGPERQFLHSKVMCWVALDRAWRMARSGSRPAPHTHWLAVRDEIRRYILESLWNDERGCFVQYEGTTRVDAASLTMPFVQFLHATDPRWTRHLQVLERELVTDALVFRYSDSQEEIDGLPGTESTFTTCSFWWVENLARSRQVERARFVFDKLLGFAGPLGLWSEELGTSGEHLGNFPQALTHLALISATLALDEEIDRSGGGPRRRRDR